MPPAYWRFDARKLPLVRDCFWPILLKNASRRLDRKFLGLFSVTERWDSRTHYIEASETLATCASVLAHVCNGLRHVRSRGEEIAPIRRTSFSTE